MFLWNSFTSGANDRLGRAANSYPRRQAMLVVRRRENRIVLECGAGGSRPGDGLFATDLIKEFEFFFKQYFIVLEVISEQREGLDETSATQRDLGPPGGHPIECRKSLIHPHRIVRGEDRDR